MLTVWTQSAYTALNTWRLLRLQGHMHAHHAPAHPVRCARYLTTLETPGSHARSPCTCTPRALCPIPDDSWDSRVTCALTMHLHTPCTVPDTWQHPWLAGGEQEHVCCQCWWEWTVEWKQQPRGTLPEKKSDASAALSWKKERKKNEKRNPFLCSTVLTGHHYQRAP